MLAFVPPAPCMIRASDTRGLGHRQARAAPQAPSQCHHWPVDCRCPHVAVAGQRTASTTMPLGRPWHIRVRPRSRRIRNRVRYRRCRSGRRRSLPATHGWAPNGSCRVDRRISVMCSGGVGARRCIAKQGHIVVVAPVDRSSNSSVSNRVGRWAVPGRRRKAALPLAMLALGRQIRRCWHSSGPTGPSIKPS